MKTRKKKSRPIFSPLDRARVVHKRFALWPKSLCYIVYAATKRDPGQCILTGRESKHRNQLIVPLPELLREKKKTRPIFSPLDRARVVDKRFT